MTKLEEVQETLSRLTTLYPDSLCYGGLADVEADRLMDWIEALNRVWFLHINGGTDTPARMVY